jgi:hypothetical protein
MLSPVSWDKVVVPTGTHVLGIEYDTTVSHGHVTVRAVLQAGRAYQVKGERDGPCDALLWLQDERSGELLGGGKQGAHLVAKPLSTGAPPFAVACD